MRYLPGGRFVRKYSPEASVVDSYWTFVPELTAATAAPTILALEGSDTRPGRDALVDRARKIVAGKAKISTASARENRIHSTFHATRAINIHQWVANDRCSLVADRSVKSKPEVEQASACGVWERRSPDSRG